MAGIAASFGLAAAPTSTMAPGPLAQPDSREFARTEAMANWWLQGAGARSGFHAVDGPRPLIANDASDADNGSSEYRLFAAGATRRAAIQGTRLAVPFAVEITHAANRHQLDDRLVAAIVEIESSFDPRVVSPRGAIGLMQIMPELAGESALDPFDPRMNLELGARYFSRLLQRYSGNVELALAAYNAGPGAVDRFGGVPPYRETNRFVERVLKAYDGHQNIAADIGRRDRLVRVEVASIGG